MARGWKELLQSLGDSLLEVVGAEAAALTGDLRHSGRQLLSALVLGLSAAFMFFWVVGASGFVLFQVLTLWWPRWGAALAVMALFLLLACLLALMASRRFQAIDLPAETVRRRFDDHKAWWQDQVLMGPGQGENGPPEQMGKGEIESTEIP